MQFLIHMFDAIVHLDIHIQEVISYYGLWTYLIVFIIVFCETGLVIMPFLPGDSLLFIMGTLCATHSLSIYLILPILIVASIGGNSLNYIIGRAIGHRILKHTHLPVVRNLITRKSIDKAHAFYEEHGGKAIVFSRFLPVLRTFAPFVAGMSEMNRVKFFAFNCIGSTLWVIVYVIGGLLFGNIPFVKGNFAVIICGIVAVTLMPTILAAYASRVKEKKVETLEKQ